jgi:hypothetical protein
MFRSPPGIIIRDFLWEYNCTKLKIYVHVKNIKCIKVGQIASVLVWRIPGLPCTADGLLICGWTKEYFLQRTTDTGKSIALFEGFQVSPSCPSEKGSMKIKKKVWSVGGMILTAESRNTRWKPVFTAQLLRPLMSHGLTRVRNQT